MTEKTHIDSSETILRQGRILLPYIISMEATLPTFGLIETSELATLIEKKTKNVRIVDAPIFPLGDKREGPSEYKKEHILRFILYFSPRIALCSSIFRVLWTSLNQFLI